MNYLKVTDGLERLATDRWRSESVDAVVFDVDGFLLDVSRSYPEVIAQSVLFYLTGVAGLEPGDSMPIDPLEVQLFKAAGGFNSDWDIAKAVVIQARRAV